MSEAQRTRIKRDVGPPTVQLRTCKLVFLKGPCSGTEYVVEGEVVCVGKGAENDLTIPDETVSHAHFEIVRDPRGYVIRDLHSTNGTFLDGAEIREAYIRAGAVISAGATEFRFCPIEERIQILPSEKEELAGMVGRSLVMRQIFGLVERIAPTDATVLIEGETGTGKDMIAHSVHALSKRKDKPFVVVDCGAVSGSLIESELFGHEKGSFTGANTQRIGAFESANGGTVFLDELGELSLDLQPKLLRVLEQREIRRVGSSETIKIDLRVIAATRMDLRAEIERGKFREDLYFRLNVVPVVAPPLRERRNDIPLLARSFVLGLSQGKAPDLSDASLSALMAHDWPGNVRELRNVLERALVLNTEPSLLVAPLRGTRGDGEEKLRRELSSFKEGLSFRQQKELWTDGFENSYLRWLMVRAEGNVSKAARVADMDRKYLHKLLKKHEIDPREPPLPNRDRS